MMRRCRGRGGFLMIEALGAMILSGLVLLGLASILSLMAAAGDRADARAAALERTTRLLAAVRRDVSGIARARWAGTDAGFVFDGTADRLLFAQDRHDTDGEVIATRLVILEVADGVLLRAEGPLPHAARGIADVAVGPAQAIGEGIAGFRYAGRLGPASPAVEVDAWPGGTDLPAAILLGTRNAMGEAVFVDRISVPVDAEPGCAATAEAFCSKRPPPDEAARER